MRFIERLPKPRILEEKEELWTKKFIESGIAMIRLITNGYRLRKLWILVVIQMK